MVVTWCLFAQCVTCWWFCIYQWIWNANDLTTVWNNSIAYMNLMCVKCLSVVLIFLSVCSLLFSMWFQMKYINEFACLVAYTDFNWCKVECEICTYFIVAWMICIMKIVIEILQNCGKTSKVDHLLSLRLSTLKVLTFWKFTSYCSLKPLWSGMGEVVPARTSPTLHPPSSHTVHQLSWLAL